MGQPEEELGEVLDVVDNWQDLLNVTKWKINELTDYVLNYLIMTIYEKIERI